MNTQQIEKVLKYDNATKRYFQGVFPSDELPPVVKHYPAAIVANVDPRGKPGSHWCAFYFSSDRKGEFFDSYGLKPGDYTQAFQDFLSKNSKAWSYNHHRLQSLDSNVCGHYCLYFLTYRCRHVDMETITARFTHNVKLNDCFVHRFIAKYFGHIYHSINRKCKNHQTSIRHKYKRLD